MFKNESIRIFRDENGHWKFEVKGFLALVTIVTVGLMLMIFAFPIAVALFIGYILYLVYESVTKSTNVQTVKKRAVEAARIRDMYTDKRTGPSPYPADFEWSRTITIDLKHDDQNISIEDEAHDDAFIGETGALCMMTLTSLDDRNMDIKAIEVWFFDKEDYIHTINGLILFDKTYPGDTTHKYQNIIKQYEGERNLAIHSKGLKMQTFVESVEWKDKANNIPESVKLTFTITPLKEDETPKTAYKPAIK